jgi:peptidyl-prolyl isomerase G (cyclophilin G)
VGKEVDEVVVQTYRGTEFHRVLPGFMIQGGDYENFDGSGGMAAPSTNVGKSTFPDENHSISHDKEGVLSMANRGKDTNGSQFFVTLGRASHLDGKHVAFGHVIYGMEVLRDASRVDVESTTGGGGRGEGRPVAMQRVIITDCGLGTGSDRDDENHVDDANVDRGMKRDAPGSRDERRRRRRRRRHDKSDDDDDDDDGDGDGDGEGNESSHGRRKRSRNDEDDGSRDRSDDRLRRRKRKRRAEKDDRNRKKHGKEGKGSRRRRDDSSSSSSTSEDERRRHMRSSKGRDYKSHR